MPQSLSLKYVQLTFKNTYFDELAEEGEVGPSKPQNVPLLAWEDLEGQEPRPDNSASTSTSHPRPSKQQNPDNKKRLHDNKEMISR